MPAHEIPTHLQVEDKLVFGLTARQILVLALAACLAYLGFQQTYLDLPGFGGREVLLPLRITLGIVPLVGGVIITFVRVLGRPLEQWAMVWWRYQTIPHRYLWQGAQRSGRLLPLIETPSVLPGGESDGGAERDEPPRRGSGSRLVTYAEVQHGE